LKGRRKQEFKNKVLKQKYDSQKDEIFETDKITQPYELSYFSIENVCPNIFITPFDV
jgi:hypothetical protein